MCVIGIIIEIPEVKTVALANGIMNLLMYAQIPMGILVKTSYGKLKKTANAKKGPQSSKIMVTEKYVSSYLFIF